MLVSKTAMVRPISNMYKYYKEKGYEIKNAREFIEVKVEDLPPRANTEVEVRCDLCGKVFTRNWHARSNNKVPNHDVCHECLSEYKRQLHKEKYGVDYPFQRKEVREKVAQTNVERYGYENVNQVPEIRERSKKKNLEKYGVESPSQNPDIVAKGLKTKFERGNQESSKTQRFICDCVDGALNYPLYNISLDVALVEEKIDIEYNGRGHDMMVRLGGISQEEFNEREDKRRHQVIGSGWKLIEICAPKDQDITKEWLIDFVNDCREKFNATDINYISININTNEIKCNTL